MAWLDYWLTIPWMLYDAAALRVLVVATLALLLIAYSRAAAIAASRAARRE